MGLYENILVTIDCSPVDTVIVEHVIKLAGIHKSTVHLLHIIHSHTLDENYSLEKKAKPELDRIKKQFEDQNIQTHIILKNGEPENEVVQAIREGDYDLVAMALHGHRHIFDILYGSVSDAVKHKTDVPILLIKPEM